MNTTQEKITPKPQPIIPAEKILFDSVQEYFCHFWKYLIVAVIVILPLGVINILFDLRTNPLYLMIFNIIIFTLFEYYSRITLLSVAGELLSDKPVNIGNIFLTSFKIYLPFAWTMILFDAIWIFGLTLCCIPGIIVGTFFYFAGGIVIWEGKRGVPALKRSFELTKPFFWRVLWILVMFISIFIIFYVLLTEIPSLFIPTIPSFLKHIFTSHVKGIIPPWWYTLYEQLIGVVISPINAIMTYILYRNLKEVNEPKEELPPELITPDNQPMQ